MSHTSPFRTFAALLITVLLIGTTSVASANQSDVSPTGCSTIDAPPIIASDLTSDGAVSASIGQDAISLTMPDGTRHDLPAGRLTFDPGMAMVLADDGTRTILSSATGEQWTFAPVAFGEAPIDISTTTSPVVISAPWVAIPIADDGLDWQIIDVRTGASRTTSDILGAPFPVATDAYSVNAPDNDAGIAAIRFSQVNQLPDDSGTIPNLGTTLMIPGTLDAATFIDLTDASSPFTDADPTRYTGMPSVVFDATSQRAAWTAPDGSGGTSLQTAPVDAITAPQTLATSSEDGYIVPMLFTPDGASLLALRDGQPVRIALETGSEDSIDVDGLSADSIHMVNPVDGTIIFDAGDTATPDITLYDAGSDTVTPLPELNDAAWIFPFDDWTYAGATMSATGSPTLVDSRTGEIIATPATTGSDASTTSVAGAYRDGIFVNGQGDTLLIQHGERGETWTMPLPPDLAPGLSATLAISPDGTCLLLATHAGESIMPERSWLAPLDPDASWTETPSPMIDWWPLAQ